MKQRIELIDSLRGFSLLGILLANLLIFQYGFIGKDYMKDLSTIDTVSYYFTKVFVESSFMPIFTFLFGYSLIKFVESIKRRQAIRGYIYNDYRNSDLCLPTIFEPIIFTSFFKRSY